MLYNPSHLEAVNPVSMGKTRAKQMAYDEGDYGKEEFGSFGDQVLNIQVRYYFNLKYYNPHESPS